MVNHKQYSLEHVGRVEQYFEHVLAFILDQMDLDHQKLAETLRAIFDPSRMFYEFNNLETDVHKYVLNIMAIQTDVEGVDNGYASVPGLGAGVESVGPR